MGATTKAVAVIEVPATKEIKRFVLSIKGGDIVIHVFLSKPSPPVGDVCFQINTRQIAN
jgi:hypothetical protein